MKINPDDIVQNLAAMNVGAKHVTHEPNEEHQKGINRVYLQSGSPHVKAFIDLAGDVPRFSVWAQFPDGHKVGGPDSSAEPLTGNKLTAHSARMREMATAELKPYALAATMIAAEGGDLDAVRDGFGLKNTSEFYAPYAGADATAPAAQPDAKPAPTPAATAGPGM